MAKDRKVKPHPKTCKKCGGTFLGMYCQCYCPECLRTGGKLLQQYRRNRKEWIE
jgi:hypothetical protein